MAVVTMSRDQNERVDHRHCGRHIDSPAWRTTRWNNAIVGIGRFESCKAARASGLCTRSRSRGCADCICTLVAALARCCAVSTFTSIATLHQLSSAGSSLSALRATCYGAIGSSDRVPRFVTLQARSRSHCRAQRRPGFDGGGGVGSSSPSDAGSGGKVRLSLRRSSLSAAASSSASAAFAAFFAAR